MDGPSGGYPQGSTGVPTRGPKKLGKKASRSANPQMFADISHEQSPQQTPAQYGPPGGYYGAPGQMAPGSGYYAPPPQSGPPQPPAPGPNVGGAFIGQQYMSDPMANMAMQYGGTLADQGKEYMQQNLEKYVSASKIKYYFAVDTSYVGKKLALLLFPFTHANWSVAFNQDEPVAPRYDVNAPDLYIPSMGFVTFVLVSAVALGLQGRFTPETIGMVTSSALGYLLLEILLILFVLYILAVQTSLTYLDWTSYCGYKYFGMVLAVLAGVYINKVAYYASLGYCGFVLVYFLTRTLKVQILPHSEDYQQTGNKRRLYVLLALSCVQPLAMWWLTYSLV